MNEENDATPVFPSGEKLEAPTGKGEDSDCVLEWGGASKERTMSEEKKTHRIDTEQGGYIEGTPAGGEVVHGERAKEIWILCEPGPAVSAENLCDCDWQIQTPDLVVDATEARIDVRCPVHDKYGLRIRIRLPGTINAELLEACKKVEAWLIRIAKQAEAQAASTNFETLREACVADARNYHAVARDLRAAIAKAEGKS